jgi:hypothetical protein
MTASLRTWHWWLDRCAEHRAVKDYRRAWRSLTRLRRSQRGPAATSLDHEESLMTQQRSFPHGGVFAAAEADGNRLER